VNEPGNLTQPATANQNNIGNLKEKLSGFSKA
jgi:hypothetical protein